MTALAPTRERAAAMLFSTDTIAGELTPRMHFKKGDAGSQVLVIEDMAVFRSGTFRDSMGFQMTWESIHIDQMVAHFDMLRNRKIFSDVPVRDGHPGFLVSGMEGNGKVIGWHTSLRAEDRTSNHDGKEYTYLIATYEILDEDAQKAIQSGLWRNRSAEVGTYFTNDEAEFWPVYQGVAYVDIPAVEGLNAFSKQHNINLMTEEGSMSSSTAESKVTPTAPTPPTPPTPPENTAPTAQHSAAQPEVHVFSIGGEEVRDYARVQAHIASLETEVGTLREFQSQTVASNRSDFVNGLASSNRILASQVESLTAFAQGLSVEQFEAWKGAMELTPENPALGTYSGGSTEHGGTQPTGEQQSPEAAKLDIDRAVIGQHKRSGMALDKIKATASYKRVIAADPNYVL